MYEPTYQYRKKPRAAASEKENTDLLKTDNTTVVRVTNVRDISLNVSYISPSQQPCPVSQGCHCMENRISLFPSMPHFTSYYLLLPSLDL